MNGRTCQFCGKPLSRIWTGGGEYCSREHRNQHRLRLGMDRLQEANKVASLMRRRENLKPIATLQPVGSFIMENLSFPAVKLSTRTPAAAFRLSPANVSAPHVTRHTAGPLAPRTRGARGESAPRRAEHRGLVPRPDALAIPASPRQVKSAVRLQPARMTVPRPTVAPRASGRRLLDILRSGPRQPILGKSPLQRRHSAPTAFPQARFARLRPSGAAAGRDLRVSRSQRFRLPRVRRRTIVIPSHGHSALRWDDAPRSLELAREFPAPPVSPALAPMPQREPRYPAAPSPFGHTGGQWPGATSLRVRDSGRSVALPVAIRVAQVDWDTAPPESTLRCEWYLSTPAITLGYSKEPHRAPSATEAGRAPVPADVRLEENFASGCANWVGEVADWRLDAAGARTGSLALFAPSLELIDYEMEFLVRVENRSVVWVFRAADTNDYYRASLRITPEGGYEFTRGSVIAGVAEPALSSPVTLPSNARTALAVRTSVRDKDFAVFVEGQAVDRWTDDRLPIGGVGFGSAPDDRARLYWVRLTYSGSPGMKEVKR